MGLDGDEVLLVEVADSFLEHLLANAEEGVDFLGRTLVAQRREATIVLQVFQQGVAEIVDGLLSLLLQREVDFAVGTHLLDVCFEAVAAVQLAEDLGMELQVVKLDWDSLILSLQKDQIDAVIAGMTATEERMKQVDFTTPYYVSEEVVIVRKDSDLANITSVQELSGKKVQGQMNTIYDDIIDQIEGVEHMPAAETFPASIQALQAGGVDAVTSELPVAIGVVAANPDLTYIRFEAGKGFTDENGDATVSIAVSKDKPELLVQLQASLDKISEDQRNQMMQDAVERQPAGE